MTQKEYRDRIIQCRSDHSKSADMQQSLAGNTIVDKMADDFELVFTFRATCVKLSYFSYRGHMELQVLEKEVASMYFPTADQLRAVEKFGRSKYTLHSQA